MRIAAKYSHLNGEEHLIVHRNDLRDQIQQVIGRIDAESCRTKQSREIRKRGQLLFSPTDLNAAFKREFDTLGWKQERRNFWVTSDERLLPADP